jgi:hypothetical protein
MDFQVVATRQDFLQNTNTAVGGLFDPTSGDFLFSQFNGSAGVYQLYEVRGFAATEAAPAPEPAVQGLIGGGLAGIGLLARRRRKFRS